MLVKFSNVIVENNRRAHSAVALYYHADHLIVPGAEATQFTLPTAGLYDFTSYFNAISIQKVFWYTRAEAIVLKLKIKGAAGSLEQTWLNRFDYKTRTTQQQVVFDASDEVHEVALTLDYPKEAVISGFTLSTEGPLEVLDAGYYLEVCEEPRTIELALCTTTFKKEAYITKNISKIKHEILADSASPLAQHLTVHVVDNGRTLNPAEIETANKTVQLHPNPNVGGSGGFKKGMELALAQDVQATHVLLMDDDVDVSTESLRRTYALLSVLKPEYENYFISGAMFNFLNAGEQHEDLGYVTPTGTYTHLKNHMYMTELSNLAYNESFSVQDSIADPHQLYAGWWYCCIPTTQIKKNGLPLPLFVRADDTEYSYRCHARFITMNGICIWHEPFEVKYSAAVERYQVFRNSLVARFATGFGQDADFLGHMKRIVRLELKKFNYTDANLVLDAFEDFLAGPEFLDTPGQAEASFMRANKVKEKLVPFDVLQQQLDEQGIKLDLSTVSRTQLDTMPARSIKERAIDFTTDNYQRVKVTPGEGFGVISARGWEYPAQEIRGKKYLVAIDWFAQTGAIRVKDVAQYRAINKRLDTLLKQYNVQQQSLEQAYSEAAKRWISLD